MVTTTRKVLKNTCEHDLDNVVLSTVILDTVDVPKAIEILQNLPEYGLMIHELQFFDALYRMLQSALQLRNLRKIKVRKERKVTDNLAALVSQVRIAAARFKNILEDDSFKSTFPQEYQMFRRPSVCSVLFQAKASVGLCGEILDTVHHQLSEWMEDTQRLIEFVASQIPPGWEAELDTLFDEANADLKTRMTTDVLSSTRTANGCKVLREWMKSFKSINTDGSFGAVFTHGLLSEMDTTAAQALRYADICLNARIVCVDLDAIKNIPTRKRKALDILKGNKSNKWGKAINDELNSIAAQGMGKAGVGEPI